MKIVLILILLSIDLYSLYAQSIKGDFKFGDISFSELKMSIYPKDSFASAVVLNEFGKTWTGMNKMKINRLFYYYHQRIKILNEKGFNQGNFSIFLRKRSINKDKINTLKATTYNLVDGQIAETQFDSEQILINKQSTRFDEIRLALPDVRVGSIIEISYTIESPFIYYIYPWQFQSLIPKMKSEYWVKTSTPEQYYAFLKGFYELDKNETERVKCEGSSFGIYTDCSLLKYAMIDIPPFLEEEYMTSKNNYLSAINFEYAGGYFHSNVKDPNNWEKLDYALKHSESFGGQIIQNNKFWKEKIDSLVKNETDTLLKAQETFAFIQRFYSWNGYNSIFSSKVKEKVGDSGDINLSLISALRYAGIQVQPIILSTRENGLPIETYPSTDNFDYVIARCRINGKDYFLDATEKFLPFGLLPLRCLNGKGRIFDSNFQSEWLEIPNKEKKRKISSITLSLDNEGMLKGNIVNTYFGLYGFNKRKEIAGFNSEQEYIESIDQTSDKIKILSYKIDNLEKLDTTLYEAFEVEIAGLDTLNQDFFLINPLILERQKENPFKLKERLYPVDFGSPQESQISVQLKYPESLTPSNLPEKMALILPEGGGKYLFNVQNIGNKLIINSLLTLDKPIYTPQEYPSLKELYNKMVQAENVDLIFEKKQ